MLNRKELEKYIIREKICIWNLGGYWIPDRVYSLRSPSRMIDVKEFRENSLDSISHLEQEFYDVIVKTLVKTLFLNFPFQYLIENYG